MTAVDSEHAQAERRQSVQRAPAHRRKRDATIAIVLSVALLAGIAICTGLGAAAISPGEVLGSVSSHLGFGESSLSILRDGIVWELRLPRVLTAVFVGAGLAVAGGVMQAITRNPLADPYLLGLSSGASLGAVFVLLLGAAILLPVAAFIGALAALVIALAIAQAAGGATPTRTVLAGVAVSAFAASFVSLLVFWNVQGDSYREIMAWLMGSLAASSWSTTAIAACAVLLLAVPLTLTGGLLDAFAFGDSPATALGVPVTTLRWTMLIAAALLTGALVSVSGAIGFVGLVVPHALRLLVGARHRTMLPLAALAGGLALLIADTIARTVFEPRELPVGVVTAIVGAPVFVYLLVRRRGAA